MGSGVVEAWLLQNVVKLWIVKRLYEFVLFAQASRFLSLSLSLFSTRARSSPFSFLSLTSFGPREDVLTLPSRDRSRLLYVLLDTDKLSFFSIATGGIHSFVGDLGSAKFTWTDNTIFVTDIRLWRSAALLRTMTSG